MICIRNRDGRGLSHCQAQCVTFLPLPCCRLAGEGRVQGSCNANTDVNHQARSSELISFQIIIDKITLKYLDDRRIMLRAIILSPYYYKLQHGSTAVNLERIYSSFSEYRHAAVGFLTSDCTHE